MFWTIIQIVIILLVTYWYIHQKYSYWSKRGINGPTGIFPLGYLLSLAITRPDHRERKWAAKYGRVYGVYTGLVPTLTIIDSELIKQVLVKDFSTYIDRRQLNAYHEIWNRNLFFAEAEDWKRIRSITSPAFTSKKLRGMFSLMNECIIRLEKYLDRVIDNDGGIVNPKHTMSGFTIDVIARAAFATVTDANNEKDRKSNFVVHGLNLFNLNGFKLALSYALPRPLLNLLGITTFFPDNSLKFFIDLTSKIIEDRKSKPNVKGNDFIQLMIDAYAYEDDLKTSNYDSLTATMDEEISSQSMNEPNVSTTTDRTIKKMNHSEIIGQCFVFFIAGFETTAGTLTHVIYELSKNQNIQERLYKEIMEDLDTENLDNQFDQILNNKPYLEAVLKETLRMYPPLVRLERRVGVDGVKLGGIPLDKNVLIEIPTVAVHYDPEYYPEPDRFNPDRFMPENRSKLVPYTYIPFGQGPRNCIGMRFAYQEAKLCLAFLVQKYRIEQIKDVTPSQLEFNTGKLMMNCKSFNVRFQKR
ncbi:hypothetical protein BLOT_001775 [Blomia tropicalis]|nr:hypothetical protein BLOT_001775 [Blomia tropicalis]